MKTAYILRVSYDGEPRLWRTMLVPGNCSAFDLCAAILSAFDTCAYHLFHLQDDGAMYNVYEPDYADGRYDQRLLTEHIVDDLRLSEGSEMTLCYDYGLYQQFIIDCEQVTEVEGRSLLPRVLDGHGCGLHLLPDFLLRFSGKALPDLFTAARISSDGHPAFPERVALSVSCDGALCYCAVTVASFRFAFFHVLLLYCFRGSSA